MTNTTGASDASGSDQAPAGWYAVEGQQRYWDGAQWTNHVAPLEGQPAAGNQVAGGPQVSPQSGQMYGQQGAQQSDGAQQPVYGQQQSPQQQSPQQQSPQQQSPQQQSPQQQPVYGQQPSPQQDYGRPASQQNYGQQAGSYGQEGIQQAPAYGQQPGGAYAQQQTKNPSTASDDNLIAALAHFGGILFQFVPSLAIWLVKKGQSPFIGRHALSALNFQITALIGYIVLNILGRIIAATGIPVIGWLITLGSLSILIGSIVFSVLGGLAANKGEDYKYPFTLSLIK